MTKRTQDHKIALRTTSPTTPRQAKIDSAAAVAKQYNGEMLCPSTSRRCSPRPSRAPLRGREQSAGGKFNSNRSQPRPFRTPRCPRKTLRKNACVDATFRRCDQSNQQYSVTALTDTTGTISERYAYDAYGKLSVFDGSGTVLSGSAYGNRYTYTGREWDGELGLYHYRARMYDPVAGRFVSRDPIGHEGSEGNLYRFLKGQAISRLDPSGLKDTEVCNYGSWDIYEYNWSIPFQNHAVFHWHLFYKVCVKYHCEDGKPVWSNPSYRKLDGSVRQISGYEFDVWPFGDPSVSQSYNNHFGEISMDAENRWSTLNFFHPDTGEEFTVNQVEIRIELTPGGYFGRSDWPFTEGACDPGENCLKGQAKLKEFFLLSCEDC